MRAKTQAERLLELEKAQGLFERRYRGVYYWHLVRRYILTAAGGANGDLLSPGGGEAGRKRRARGVLRDCLLQLGQFPLRRTDVLLSLSQADMRMVDGAYFDPYSRLMTLPATWTLRTLEGGADHVRRPTKGCISRCYMDLARLARYACMRIRPRCFADEAEDAYLDTLAALLQSEMGSPLSASALRERVRLSVASFSVYYAGLKRYLQKLKPRAVLMVCAYNLTHHALAYAARELGVPTAELQHGNILRRDIAYNFLETAGSRRYFPDAVFTFGSFWSEQTRLPQGCSAVAVGSALADFYRQRLAGAVQDPKGVVFYSNYTQAMADMACALADRAIPAGYTVTFKYHPAQLAKEKGRYVQLAEHGVHVEETAVSVYEYLAANRHHVGGATTCLSEAMLYGGHGYMLRVPGYESYEAFFEAGYIEPFDTAEALFAAMEKNGAALEADPARLEAVWRPGAAEHLREALVTLAAQNEKEQQGRGER